MQAFEFYCPTKIYFGKGAEARVGEAVKHFGGTKVFIVYGGPTRACPTRARACRRRSRSARTSFSASAAAA